ncbi:juvenile hormone esterase-like [Lutzomyia longipalpis]|uniref:juvenile hormone esterase-like n=1 Tax=Lutzomyia longipalpis TaxID=7200 RepID=UPI002483E631|nr:juvenile hormone esterase-like [Lutzomyia longipalpis]
MKILLLLSIFLLNFALRDGRISESLKVTLPHGGELIGKYLSSHRGRGIRAFMGVPYAEPPVGALRFSNPVLKTPWTGSLNAFQESSSCLSYDYLFGGNVPIGSEDCLYLNIYVPQRPKTTDPLPVMVYLHGGGFQSGSGGKAWYGPDYILDHDVILVVGNYRLGVFGFLSTNTPDSPGNYGLKDQALMLKWVQENIVTFGGDNDSVTIFGESAGGASVTYHTVSPLSRGLFHRAISQSGTHFGLWALQKGEAAAKNARRLAETIKCPSSEENVPEMLDCLRSISAKEINSHFYDFFYWNTLPMIMWSPVIEPQSDGAFMYEDPKKVPASEVPLMIGITSDEGLMLSAGYTANSKNIEDIKNNITDILPYLFSYHDYDSNTQKVATNIIKEFYFKDRDVDLNVPEIFKNFTNLVSDGYFTSAVDAFLQSRLPENLSSNTFLYLFNHMGDSGFVECFFKDFEKDLGVSHLDDLIYLFPILKENFFKIIPTEVDDFVRENMVAMWVNFAKTGNPTTYAYKFPFPQWNTAGSFPYNYLRIGNFKMTNRSVIGMERGLLEERATLWRKIYAALEELGEN